MALKEDFQFGDVIASHGDRFLSKAIQFFMRIYTKNILKKKYKVIFNHTANVISYKGEKWIAEAMTWGVQYYPIEKSGYLTQKEIVILRDMRGFSEEQIGRMTDKMFYLSRARYQYEAMLQWMDKISNEDDSEHDLFRNSNEKSIFCSELSAIFINIGYPNTFKRPNATSPMDHFYAENYEIIDINGILK